MDTNLEEWTRVSTADHRESSGGVSVCCLGRDEADHTRQPGTCASSVSAFGETVKATITMAAPPFDIAIDATTGAAPVTVNCQGEAYTASGGTINRDEHRVGERLPQQGAQGQQPDFWERGTTRGTRS